MNDKERFHAIMGFEKPDRVLYWEQGFWGGTVERWYAEGMPRRHGVQGDPAYGDTVRGPATPIGPGARVCLEVLEEHGERLAAERLDPGSPERFPQDWNEQVKRLNACDGVVGLGGTPAACSAPPGS
jgi:hypothetical protein